MEVNYGSEAEKTIQLNQRSSGRRDYILLRDMYRTKVLVPNNFPTTEDNFKIMVTQVAYFIDKTLMIEFVINKVGRSMVILRPRRFGKSLFLTMIEAFFQKIIHNQTGKEMQSLKNIFIGGHFKVRWNQKILKPLKIAQKCLNLVNQYQGKYPLIYLDLQLFSPKTQKQFIAKFGSLVSDLIHSKFQYLESFLCGNKIDFKKFRELKNNQADVQLITESLTLLIQWLYDYHKTAVVLLIDQYDHPLTTMFYQSCTLEEREKVKKRFQMILQPILKGNHQLLFKGILVGIVDVFSSDTDSGLSNCEVFDSVNPKGYSYFGFSEGEIKQMIKNILKINFDEKFHDKIDQTSIQIVGRIRDWYNGYYLQDFQKTIYNSYEVIRYLDQCTQTKKIMRPDPFWVLTRSDNFFIELFSKLSSDLFNKMAWVVFHPKKSKKLQFSKKIGYSKLSLDENISQKAVSYLLLYTGYLTGFVDQSSESLQAVIPNQEICMKLNNLILAHFKGKIDQKDIQTYRYLEIEEQKKLKQLATFIISKYQNILGYKNEALFRCLFFVFLKSNQRHSLSTKVNMDEGRIDHIFYPYYNSSSKTVIIHQYKYDQVDSLKKEKKTAEQALWQIYTNDYLGYALDKKESSYENILLRSFAIEYQESNDQKISVIMSQDQSHSLKNAQLIVTEVNRWRLHSPSRMDEAWSLFQKKYKERKDNNEQVILKVIEEMNKNYSGKNQQQKQSEVYRQISRMRVDNILLQKNINEVISKPLIELKAKNFDYNKVGSSLPGVIGQFWNIPQESSLVKNFKKVFMNGFRLYCCNFQQIMEIQGMTEEYASEINQCLKQSRLIESNFTKERVLVFIDKERERQKKITQFFKKI